jgi:predicted Zn-dependent protease
MRLPLVPRPNAVTDHRWLPLAILMIALSMAAGCTSRSSPAAQAQAPQGSGRLYFVPVGDFPASTVEHLTDHYATRFGVTFETLAPVALDPSAIDARRQQAIGERLTELVRTQYPHLGTDPDSVVIALTTQDMYIQEITNWRFAFAMRERFDNGSRFTVVSTGRMDPVLFGLPPDEELLHTRLRKMVTKQIGILYFGLAVSTDPRSVLSTPLSVDELDAMGEDF